MLKMKLIQKQIENKQLSEVAVQKYFQRTRQQKEEELEKLRNGIEVKNEENKHYSTLL